jgi:hypothetical protein
MPLPSTPSRESDSLISPLLTTFAVTRTGDTSIPGWYSSNHRVWVVESRGEIVPIIQLKGKILEEVTKTKIEVESDDQSVPFLLEELTKTAYQLERDDDNRIAFTALELTTKTATRLERDDIA